MAYKAYKNLNLYNFNLASIPFKVVLHLYSDPTAFAMPRMFSGNLRLELHKAFFTIQP